MLPPLGPTRTTPPLPGATGTALTLAGCWDDGDVPIAASWNCAAGWREVAL